MQIPRRRVSGLAWACICAATVVVLLGTLPGKSWADIINGSAELDVNLSHSKTKDPTGAVTSDTRGNEFTHKYNISLDVNPFPLLKVSAGSVFLQDIATLHDISTTSHSKSTTLSPYLDLKLNNLLYQGGLGYSRTDSWQTGTQGTAPTTINEEYHATLGWRPVGLPDLTLRLSHANTFDDQRAVQDSMTNMVTLGSRYAYKSFNFGYMFTGTDAKDHLSGTDSTTLLHNGSLSYSDHFFNQRVAVYSHYNVNYLESTTKAGNGGDVDTPLFPVSGLSAFTIDPSVGTVDQNVANPAVIDGNLVSSAGINLGVVAPLVNTNNKWSIGADFFNVTELNKILIWVDRQLPAAIAGAFTWQVWVRNTDTDNWTQIDQSGNQVAANSANTIPATFGPFQNSFTLTLLHSVKARFIKVVVNTLPQSIALTNPSFQNPDRITVTEFQGMLSQPAAQVQGTSSKISQSFNVDVRTRLLDSPSLYHSLNFSLSATSPGGGSSYVLANNLILDHRLNRIFTVGANVGREDISSGNQQITGYLYNASLRATPLSGLNNTLVYSGRIDHSSRGTTDSNSLFLSNTAQVYKGIAFNLSGGYTLATNLLGQKLDSMSFVGGTSISPRQDLNFSLSYNYSSNTLSGTSTTSPSSTSTQSGNLNVTYRPFPNLYLFAGWGVQQAENQTPQLVQNYGGTWAPFPDGDLQFNFVYNQNISSVNNEKNTTMSPTISWKIAPKAMLNLSYSLLTSDSLMGSTKSNYVSMILRLSY